MNNLRFDRVIDLAAKDTKKGARIVAKVFYRILRRKGFSKNQIIDIATNIIDCLTVSLKGYEKRIDKTKGYTKNEYTDSPSVKKVAPKIFTEYGSRYDKYDSRYDSPYL